MKKIIILLKVLVLLTICTGTALAEPKNGFGLNAGLTTNNMSGTAIPGGTTYSYSSAGSSIGLDYQFAVSDRFSINPFFTMSSENPSGTTNPTGNTFQSGTSVSHGLVGLEFRYWINDVFIGGHADGYIEDFATTTSSTSSTSTIGSGGGRGLVVGWEPSSSRWFLMGQVDAANIGYTTANVSLVGYSISVGYRWK